jgi:hypothetical protein
MPVTIDQVTAQQYSKSVYLLSQQMGSKYEMCVRKETVSNAEAAYFDTLAEDDDTAQKTGRHQGTPISEAEFGRRKVIPYPWTNKKVLDKEDLDRMLPDPRNALAQNQARSLGRKKDDLIIAAALGNAAIGKTGASTVALDDESIGLNSDGSVTTLGTAPAYAGASSTGLTKAKMLKMMQLFNEADVDPDIMKYWAVAPSDIEYMLSLTEVGSADYNTVKALQQGKMDAFAGFMFKWSNRLLDLTDTNEHWRTFAWAMDGIILASIGDIQTRMEEAERLDFAWVIFAKMDLGAVRLEGEKVHECLTYKTPTIS